jgi:hypothetical protein
MNTDKCRLFHAASVKSGLVWRCQMDDLVVRAIYYLRLFAFIGG